jgi:hypothetical protein
MMEKQTKSRETWWRSTAETYTLENDVRQKKKVKTQKTTQPCVTMIQRRKLWHIRAHARGATDLTRKTKQEEH